ncbi:Laminin subunit alpha-5, partial [Anabarilius grahami]
QGQYCDICTSEDTNRAHPVSNAIDGTERWWQSPPLSRSVKYNEVNVTLDLGQVCCRCIPYNWSNSLSHPPPTRTYRVQITQRTVESSDTRLQQALLWMAHEC